MSGKRDVWLPHEAYSREPGLIDETLYKLCRAYLDDSDKQWPEEWLPILAHRFCDYLDEIKASGRQQAGGRPGGKELPDLSSQPDRTEGGQAIMRSVTVFSTIDFGRDQIVTGWIYPNGKASSPTSQYCYYAIPNADGTSKQIPLGDDGKANAQNRKLVHRFDNAFARCQWWKGV